MKTSLIRLKTKHGFSLTEVLIAIAVGGVAIGALAQIAYLVYTAVGNTQYRTGVVELNEALLRIVSDADKCSTTIEKRNLDLGSGEGGANHQLGMPIAINTGDPALNTLRDGTELPLYKLRLVRLRLTNPVLLPTYSGSNRQYYGVILSAQFEPTTLGAGQKISPMRRIASFSVEVNGSTIESCQISTVDPVRICGNKNMVYYNQPFTGPTGINSNPDPDGCIDPRVFIGQRGDPGPQGPPGDQGPALPDVVFNPPQTVYVPDPGPGPVVVTPPDPSVIPPVTPPVTLPPFTPPSPKWSDRRVKMDVAAFDFGLREVVVTAEQNVSPSPLAPIDPDRINMMLINAIKEQQREIQRLEKEILLLKEN